MTGFIRGIVGFTVLLALFVLFTGCDQKKEVSELASQELTVLVAKIHPASVSISDELPGRVRAYRTAEIRPQVSGVIVKRTFEQGSDVPAGQTLFQIDAAPFKAESDAAEAALRRAEVTYGRARLQAERLRPLAALDAVSRQSYDDAVANRDQLAADVAQARAVAERRRLDVDFARITAPIEGRIGRALVTEGALVNSGSSSPLATIQQISEVYVDVQQPTERFQRFQRAVESGTADIMSPVEIRSLEGAPYQEKGKLLFSDVTVDPATSNAIVRILVSNGAHRLLPGMFVRVMLPLMRINDAIIIPQQAVSHGNDGAEVKIVDSQQKIRRRNVTVGDVVDNNYIIISGLTDGETVVVEGQDRTLPGQAVKTKLWSPVLRNAR